MHLFNFLVVLHLQKLQMVKWKKVALDKLPFIDGITATFTKRLQFMPLLANLSLTSQPKYDEHIAKLVLFFSYFMENMKDFYKRYVIPVSNQVFDLLPYSLAFLNHAILVL